jgi:hypothetical protein
MRNSSTLEDEQRAATWVLQEVAVGILRDVVARCSASSIEFLPVKGVVTSRLLYDDVADRPLTDVDIRIRARDFPAFRRMAAQAGWREVGRALTYRIVVYGFRGLSLDVEAVMGAPGLCALTVDTMLKRASLVELAPGLRLRVPEIHDHAIVLVLNVFKDKLPAASGRAVSDVERIARHPQFRGPTFARRAVEARTATLSWLVAHAMELRGSEAWGEVRRELDRSGHVRYAYARWVERLNRGPDPESTWLRVLSRLAADSPLMRAEALVGAAAWELERAIQRRNTAP